jgi:STE24 endopeptidase
MLVITVVGTIITTPFSAWRSLSYDRRWGFSTQKAGGFLADMAKGFPLGLVIEAVLFVPLWAIVRATSAWWLFGWGLFALFTVIFNVLFPVLIAPIFNKYTPLEDEALRTQLLGVAAKVEADISEYLVEDASKRDTRQNAYVAGLGKTRRVVIYDTMLSWPHEQINNVVAHEIGHWKLRHIRRLLPAAVGFTFITFALLKVVLEWERALSWAGVSSVRDPAVFPLFLLVFTLAGPVTGLGVAWLSRAQERQADLFALDTLRQPETFIGMMRRLHTDTLADLTPSLWKRISHSHPPVAERLAMGRSWGERNGVAEPPAKTRATAKRTANGDGAPKPTRTRPLRAPR